MHSMHQREPFEILLQKIYHIITFALNILFFFKRIKFWPSRLCLAHKLPAQLTGVYSVLRQVTVKRIVLTNETLENAFVNFS